MKGNHIFRTWHWGQVLLKLVQLKFGKVGLMTINLFPVTGLFLYPNTPPLKTSKDVRRYSTSRHLLDKEASSYCCIFIAFIYLFILSFICLFIYLYIYLFIHLFIYLFIYLRGGVEEHKKKIMVWNELRKSVDLRFLSWNKALITSSNAL